MNWSGKGWWLIFSLMIIKIVPYIYMLNESIIFYCLDFFPLWKWIPLYIISAVIKIGELEWTGIIDVIKFKVRWIRWKGKWMILEFLLKKVENEKWWFIHSDNETYQYYASTRDWKWSQILG